MSDDETKRFSQDDLRIVGWRAWTESHRVRNAEEHAAFEQESLAWLRLAEAAYACESILVRHQLGFVQGPPTQVEFPEEPTDE